MEETTKRIRLGETGLARIISLDPPRVEICGIEAPLDAPPREQRAIGDEVLVWASELFVEDGQVHLEVSRVGPDFVRALMLDLIPAVGLGEASIVRITRIDGVRTKVALRANTRDIDPIAEAVGPDGAHIRKVVAAIGGEPIDLVPWDADPVRFVCNAISPVRVVRVMLDKPGRRMELIVADDDRDRFLANENAQIRLAANLTGWGLDVFTESRWAQLETTLHQQLDGFQGVSAEVVGALFKAGYVNVSIIAGAQAADLAEHAGISHAAAEAAVAAAQSRVSPEAT